MDPNASYKTSRLKFLLLVPPEKRTKVQIDEICDFTYDMNFLEAYRNDERLYQICSKLVLVSATEEEVIFEQDEEGDAMYLILSGTVGVYDMRDKDGDLVKHLLATLQPGATLGELSLLYGDNRTAMAVAHEDCDLLSLRKEDFDSIIKGNTKQQMRNIVAFLEQVDALHGVQETVLKRLATRCDTKLYGTYNTIIRQGENVSKLYFIKHGKVKILKKIDFRKVPTAKANSMEELIQDPTKEDYLKKAIDTKMIDINELGVGDYFGEIAVLTSVMSDYSVVTTMSTEVLMVDKTEFLNIDKATIHQFLSLAKAYPADREYRKNYYKTQRWEEYKSSLVDNVMSDKLARKNKHAIPFRSKTPQKPRATSVFSVKDTQMYGKPTMHQKLPPISNIYTMINPRLQDFIDIDPFDFLSRKKKANI